LNFPQGLVRFPSKEDAEHTRNLLGVRYIVVDRSAYDDARFKRIASILKSTYSSVITYQDAKTAVFQYPREHRSYRSLGFSVSDKQS